MTDGPALVHASHASGLRAVERELAELHRRMLRDGADETRAVRLSVLTLVAACVDAPGADLAAEVVATVAERHPARALIIVADPSGQPHIEADLSLQCSIAGNGRVCAEQVRLDVGGPGAFHLDSVVMPLLLPDVPVVLWLVGEVPLDQALRRETLDLCEQVIVDSDAYADTAGTLRRLAGATRTEPLADLAWTRSAPWREALAIGFDHPALRPFVHGVRGAAIDGGGAAARLCAGWLRSRLHHGGDDGLRVTGARSAPIRSWRVDAEHDGRNAVVAARTDGGSIVVTAQVDGQTVDERSLPLDERATAALVGGLIEDTTGIDPLYAAALRAATELP